MRIWSLHPKYLDTKGLVALWRESLLAKNVLEGRTKGYKNHPQLLRFKTQAAPLDCMNQYLAGVFEESLLRGFNFDAKKINQGFSKSLIPVTSGQIEFEGKHLLKKLKVRNPNLFRKYRKHTEWELHPIFVIVEGEIESWEVK